MTTPQPGSYGVTKTYGNKWDRLVGWLIRYGTNSNVNHAFVVTNTDKFGRLWMVEAQPGGARLSPISSYPDAVYSQPLRPDVAMRVASEAVKLLGRQYNWLDIVCIALAQRRLGRVMRSWNPVARRVSNMDRLICSELVDLAYHNAGIELWDDGRLPGLVSPGDLGDLILSARNKADA